MTNDSNASQLEDLKTVLNSLVIPYPNGLTLRQLCNEYQELEGQSIPYRELGFTSLTSLLKSMSNMIRMIGNLSDISSVTLFPVKNESTKHIIDLVERQAKNRKKGSRRGGGYQSRFSSNQFRSANTYRSPLSKSANNYRNNSFQNNAFSRPVVNSVNSRLLLPLSVSQHINMSAINGWNGRTALNNINPLTIHKTNMTSIGQKFLDLRITKTLNKFNEQQSRSVQTQSSTDFQSPSVNGYTPQTDKRNVPIPKQIKENIELMMSSPDLKEGFMLFNFDARYRQQFKNSLDYKTYGFDTLADCLQSLPDVLEMIPTGTKTFKLMPIKTRLKDITNEVSVTPTTSVTTNGHSMAIMSSTQTTTCDTLVTTQSKVNSCMVSTIPRKTFTIRSEKAVRPPEPVIRVSDSTLKRESEAVFRPIEGPTVGSTVGPIVGPIVEPTNKNFDTRSECSSASNDLINNKAKQNFRIILSFNDNGINALDFPSEYENYFKVAFDSRIWGFKSAIEMFHSLPNIFSIEINDKNETLLHDSRFKRFDNPKPVNKIDLCTSYKLKEIDERLKARVLLLVKKSAPLGLEVSQFVDLFGLTFDSIDQTLRHLRIQDAFHLFDILKHELPINVNKIDGQYKVFIKSNEDLIDWTVRQTRNQKFEVPITLVDTPPNVVLPGESFREPRLPEKFKPGNYEYVAVYISSAVNPHEIFIQFKGKEYHTSLETLMFSLEFYETVSEQQWAVPYEFLYVGYPVICRYPGDKNWHRARITRLHASNRRVVTVSFVDYGGTTVLDYRSLRLMKKEFLSLPIQALKVGLFGIKPLLGNKATDWTASARDKVLQFSKPQYALACTLIEVTPENRWVAICDTNTSNDIFLHCVLVNDRHAVMSD